MDRGWDRITGRADPLPMRSTHYQSDKPQRHHLTPMGDPTGYLDEGKGLPWITMDGVILLQKTEGTVLN